MRQKTLVDSEETFRLDGFRQAIEDSLVKISVLVIEARHDGVCYRLANSQGFRGFRIRRVRKSHLADA